MKKDKAIRNAKNFDELLNIQYGKIGKKKRDAFEERAREFGFAQGKIKLSSDFDEPLDEFKGYKQ